MIAPRPTTFLDASALLPDVPLLIAAETFQHTGSFKFRAAYEVARNASQPHIIAASSGNFGQALAFACQIFGKRCTIVMPETSAKVKVDAVGRYGATVDLVDVTRKSRDERVAELAAEDPKAYISSAFDDSWVIAGNASLGREILARPEEIGAIVAPVGGGGLTSGLAIAIRENGRKPILIGAEPLLGNDAARSFRAGELLSNAQEPATIADGARTRSLGTRNWEILHDQSGLSDIVEVPDEAIVEAVRTLFLRSNLKVEPTGALAVAAVLTNPSRFTGLGTVCCVVSGGNVDPSVYAKILLGEG